MSNASAERRAILQVRWGPMAFRKAVLKPGQSLRVGKAETMDLPLPHDSHLAGEHFELTWDGAKCRIRDLNTITGTLLDGRPIKEGIVPPSGWIRAGETDFVAYIERHTPPTATAGADEPPQRQELKCQALNVLNAQEGLYAVLDAAQDKRILILLQESVEEYRSLYEGPQGAALADVAPHIVRLPKDSPLLVSLVHEGWVKHWGFYFTSTTPFAEVRRHLRKLLMVGLAGEAGRFYFRFYDPRVLKGFLPTCETDQRKDFFGPITRFLYEDAEEHTLLTAVP